MKRSSKRGIIKRAALMLRYQGGSEHQIYTGDQMPTKDRTTRQCRLCFEVESVARFPKTGRLCCRCKQKRSALLRSNPNQPHLQKAHRASLFDRVMRRRQIDQNGCWLWTGFRSRQGYGIIGHVQVAGREVATIPVHRLMAHMFLGLDLSKPRYLYACHYCDNPPCFNPNHLFIGTPGDNSNDCKMKGRERHQLGEQNGGGGKLTEKDIIQIRAFNEHGLLQRQIAEYFGVDQTMISHILSRKQWAHVPEAVK